MSDATQMGVSETTSAPDDTTTEAPESARLSAMEQIAENNRLKMQAEQAQHDLENGVVRDTTATPAPEQQPVDQVNLQLDGETIIDEAQLAKFKVRTKVDGVEKLETVATIRNDWQKNGAADKRLAEASELLKQARAFAEAPPKSTAPPVVADAKAGSGDITPADEVKRKFVTAMFKGDMDEAIEALEKVLPGATATQSLDQLTEQLTPVVMQQLAEKSALDKFATDFDYLVADPYLADLADQNLVRVMKEEPALSYDAQLSKAGEATRDWMVSKGMKVPEKADPVATAPTTDRSKRLAAKAASDQVAGTSARAKVDEPKVETPSDVIAGMRAARGMEA